MQNLRSDSLSAYFSTLDFIWAISTEAKSHSRFFRRKKGAAFKRRGYIIKVANKNYIVVCHMTLKAMHAAKLATTARHFTFV